MSGSAYAQSSRKFDFGAAATEAGYVAVGSTAYSVGTGYGWTSTTGLNLRDRGEPDALRTNFIFKNTSGSNVFRISGLTANGKYLLKVLSGDADFGDHITIVSVPGVGSLATLASQRGEYLELSATVNADATGVLEITFSSPTPNWAVNALTLNPTTSTITTSVTSTFIDEWDPTVFAVDPTQALLNSFNGTGAVGFTPTGLTRADYLTLIGSEVDFWKTKQNSSGAIIDPYRNAETQYATPAYANAAAALVAYAGRTDLLETAAKAMDWVSTALHNGTAADGHDDFYPGMVANAYRVLSSRVTSTRATTWANNLNFNPWSIYTYEPGSFNWTVVASSGEALIQALGFRSTSNSYVPVCWGAQGRHFNSPYGLYEEGPMAYDHFPRIWLADALAKGYTGPFSTQMAQAMDRASVTSLFMQSSFGEMPAGGRSAHHQWNEAEQCVTYEIYAAKAEAAGNALMAAAYKRGAHLALSSLRRWVRPSGEMQIVKNWVDPSSRHGYESYSYHSQYNLLPMAMLAIAYEHAASSEDMAEGPAPADTGGYSLKLDNLHKIIANAGGTYVELDTAADHHYDATGLIRIHKKGIVPNLGPSDSLLASASYTSPNPAPTYIGVGVSWQDSGGSWITLGSMTTTQITSVVFTPILQTPSRVVFDVTYSGALPNVTSITEHYIVTPDGVQLTTELAGYTGPLRYVWPVFSKDGKTTSSINVSGKTVSVSQGGTPQTFTTPAASTVSVGTSDYSNHNGWARIATAEFPNGGAVTLLISQTTTSPYTAYWQGDANSNWNTNTSGQTNWATDAAGTTDLGQLPDSSADVIFATTSTANTAASVLGSDISIRSLDVKTSSAVGIGGTNNLTLGTGGLIVESGAGATTINTTGQVVLGASQTWSNTSAAVLTVSSAISGSGLSLTKEGGGSLVLTGANTYTGGTTITGGTLVSTINGLNGGPIAIDTGATLTFTGNNQTSATTLTGAGTILNSNASNTIITGDHSGFAGTFTHSAGNNNTQFNSAVSGSPNAAYTITAGELIFALSGNYTVKMGSLASTGGNIRGGNSATGTTTLEVGNLGTNTTIAGNVNNGTSKTLALTKVGGGTLTLQGTNTFTGATLISAGTLQIDGSLATASLTNNAALVFNYATDRIAAYPIGGTGTLTKQGAGKLTLGGTNTYTGDTTVNAGTLAVDGDSLADGGKLAINGGKVYVTGMETVNALFFGAVQQAAGTWGASGSAAANIDDTYFNGTGVMNVAVGPAVVSPYESWAAAKGLIASNKGAAQDPDLDGIANAVEFSLGGNPLVSDTDKLPVVASDVSNFIFTFTRDDASEDEISLTFQYGSALAGWTDIAINAASAGSVTVNENSTSLDTVVVTVPKTSAVGGKLFGRLKGVK